MSPLISIVMATYNRSTVIGYAIQSVLQQTYTHWELIVIGDQCTDNTENIVNSFQDKRITFHNLKENHGEQSVPNNEGARRAQGDYIAFLNHDDLWINDHLQLCLNHIVKKNADIVYCLAVKIQPNGFYTLVNGNLTHVFSPKLLTPASTWLMRRSVHFDLNGWQNAQLLYNAPSQDFLYRAWLQNKSIILSPFLTAVLIPSGARINSYRFDNHSEIELYLAKIQNPMQFRIEALTTIAITEQSNYLRTYSLLFLFKRLVKNIFVSTCILVGVNPNAFLLFLQYRRRGGFIHMLRQKRGLQKKLHL